MGGDGSGGGAGGLGRHRTAFIVRPGTRRLCPRFPLASRRGAPYPRTWPMMPGTQPNPYPAAGEIIDGKYQIEKVLGEGGMGCVARAYHLLLRAPVALKFMNPQYTTFPGAVERFINEGIASKRIR